MPADPASRPVGAHVPVVGGLASGAFRYAEAIGAEAIGVFSANPRAWALPTADPDQDATFAGRCAGAGLLVFLHAPYLINVGSPDPLIRERSAASLRHALRRGQRLGARAVVVHAGSATDGDRAGGLRRARDVLLPVLDAIPDDGPELLLEPMAGRGQMLCTAVSDLAPYLDALAWHPRAGLCLDTCHLFAAGHDLAAPGGVRALFAELASVTGRERAGRLRLIHANDSKDACGSRRDRHEHIGAGHLGTAPFAELLRHPATRGVPFIVETAGPREAHAADVAALKRLRNPGAAAQEAWPAGQRRRAV